MFAMTNALRTLGDFSGSDCKWTHRQEVAPNRATRKRHITPTESDSVQRLDSVPHGGRQGPNNNTSASGALVGENRCRYGNDRHSQTQV